MNWPGCEATGHRGDESRERRLKTRYFSSALERWTLAKGTLSLSFFLFIEDDEKRMYVCKASSNNKYLDKEFRGNGEPSRAVGTKNKSI